MIEPPKLWPTLSDEKKLLIKGTAFAALGLYVLLQLVSLFLPLAITAGIVYWVYKAFLDTNPKVYK